jgi:hypothetical protein
MMQTTVLGNFGIGSRDVIFPSVGVYVEASEVFEKSEPNTEYLWQQAYELVEAKKRTITGYARRFLPYSSYSLDEFIQQAYESAYRAFDKCLEKGESDKYEGYFWKQYLKDCYKMANIPSRKKFYEECIKNSIKDHSLAEEILKELSCSPITLEEYRECSEDDATATAVASSIPDPLETAIGNEESLDNELKELIQEDMIEKALMLMTKREKQVWDYLLGHHGRIYSMHELVPILGLKKSRLIALRDNSLSFIRKTFSATRLYTLRELSDKSGYSIATLRLMKRYGFLKANEDYIQRVKNSSALFTDKAINKLLTRATGKNTEKVFTKKEFKARFKKQKLYTFKELSDKSGYSIATLRSMRCYGFFENGREVIRVAKATETTLPLTQGGLTSPRASGESTEAKIIAGRTRYLFTEKALKKLILRRKLTMARTKNKKSSILSYQKQKPIFISNKGIDIDSPLPKAKYEFTDAFIVPAHISPTPSISIGGPV